MWILPGLIDREVKSDSRFVNEEDGPVIYYQFPHLKAEIEPSKVKSSVIVSCMAGLVGAQIFDSSSLVYLLDHVDGNFVVKFLEDEFALDMHCHVCHSLEVLLID